jgi:flagellar basal body rod protein FlgG
MDASLWVAKTGLDAQQTRMNVISNNLANVNTTGLSATAPSLKTCSTKISNNLVVKHRRTLCHLRA